MTATADIGDQDFLSRALVGWDGIQDEEGNPVVLDETSKRQFLDDPETEKYWFSAIYNYLYPNRETLAQDSAGLDEVPDPLFLTRQ